MKLKALVLAGTAMAVLSFGSVQATTVDITMINGTGVPNDGWTAVTDNGIQVALRARTAYVGGVLPNDGNGNYFGTPGFAPAPHGANANWNWDFSVTNPRGLGTADYYISVDMDSSSAFNSVTYAVGTYPDNSYGDASTPNSGGDEGLYVNHLTDTVMQNSENITFYPQSAAGLDPMSAGIYNFSLFAVPLGAGANATHLSEVNMRVTIGDVSAPDGGATLGMLGMGFAGVVGLRKRLKK